MSFLSTVLPHDTSTPENAMAYAIKSILSGNNHVVLCSVIAVSGKKCDVLPLVTGVQADGVKISNITVHDIPYWRLQSGISAVVMPPRVGDIGLMLVSDKDITNVKESGAESPPGSNRRHNLKDGIYMGSIAALMQEPTEYLEMTGSGVNIVAPSGITITGNVTISGSVTTDSTIDAAGEITGSGIALSTHTHGGVETGGGSTGAPQ